MSSPRVEGAGTAGSVPWERWLFAGVWFGAAVLGYAYLGRGWIPHDVGTLGHAAERVLAGELPHRDFVDVYTGGQAMLHALAFRVFGVELMTLRFVFFGAYLLWVPTVWLVARSFAGPALAAASTLMAASLTLPVYPEGMPSWYNLYLATAGVACLLRYLRDRRALWLVLAGAAGGVSILFKVVGLYYVAGALLFLLYLETTDEAGEAPEADASYRVAAALACMVFAFAALYVVAIGGGAVGLLHFAVPPLAAVTVVASRLTHETGRSSADRFRSMSRTAVPLIVGVAAPVALFLVPYALSGSLDDLYRGVLVLPRLRFDFAARTSLPVLGFVPAAALVAWLASRSRGATLAGGALVLALVATSHVDVVYRIVWWTLTSLGPIAAASGAWLLMRPAGAGVQARTGTFLLLAVFGFANLVQIPFSAPVYFLYAAPLLVLLAVALAADEGGSRSQRLLFATTVLVGFSIFRLDAGFIQHLGFRFRPHEETEALEIERAQGIRVSLGQKREIEQLVAALERMDTGPAILALPDAPEVYFLTGLDNPTRTLFDFFDGQEQRTEQVLSLVDDLDLRVVVLNRGQIFSPAIEGPLLDGLEARFSWSAEVGRFRIIWKGPPRAP